MRRTSVSEPSPGVSAPAMARPLALFLVGRSVDSTTTSTGRPPSRVVGSIFSTEALPRVRHNVSARRSPGRDEVNAPAQSTRMRRPSTSRTAKFHSTPDTLAPGSTDANPASSSICRASSLAAMPSRTARAENSSSSAPTDGTCGPGATSMDSRSRSVAMRSSARATYCASVSNPT
jgi:hypothetical protein